MGFLEAFFASPAKILDKLASLFKWNMEPIPTDPVEAPIVPSQAQNSSAVPIVLPQYPDARVQPSEPSESLLDRFIDAIQAYEGWGEPGSTVNGIYYPEGTLSYVNKNIGNLRCGVVMAALATGCDSRGFCIFPTIAAGRQQQKNNIVAAASGKSEADGWYPTMTIAQYFEKRDPPADKNNPAEYADWVAGEVGINTTDPISKLLT